MRITSNATATYSTRAAAIGPGRRVDFIQAAGPRDLAARIAQLAKELAAEIAEHSWVLTFIDLAGAGDGHTFVFMLTWADETGADISASGLPADDLGATVAQASESEALSLASFGANAGAVRVEDELLVFDAFQSYLAGTSSGTRFMTGVVGEVEPV
jgi:hypothetical protein